jgi:hypothetical protein
LRALQIIKQVAELARQTPPQQQVYWTLLMITDGAISDMDTTMAEIVNASDLPISLSTHRGPCQGESHY